MQRRGEEGRRAGGGGDEEGRRVGESCRQLELRSECHQSPGTQEVGDGGMIFEGMYLFMSNNALPLAWEAVRVTFGDFLLLRFFLNLTPPEHIRPHQAFGSRNIPRREGVRPGSG